MMDAAPLINRSNLLLWPAHTRKSDPQCQFSTRRQLSLPFYPTLQTVWSAREICLKGAAKTSAPIMEAAVVHVSGIGQCSTVKNGAATPPSTQDLGHFLRSKLELHSTDLRLVFRSRDSRRWFLELCGVWTVVHLIYSFVYCFGVVFEVIFDSFWL